MGEPLHGDLLWMDQAVALARLGEGQTRPNPPVGAVVVRNGKAIGRGYHRRAGGPHAEVLAIRQAGTGAKGATLYVTLEPCSTWGRTPPCTDLIRRSGIRRVVVGARDPNPRHRGRGLRVLRQAGIGVQELPLGGTPDDLLAPFRKWIRTRRPFLTLKLGMTIDGRIADGTGRSRWITGGIARRHVRQWRGRCDAILIGAGTAVQDDPGLLPARSSRSQPFRVIVDSCGRIPAHAGVLSDRAAPRTILAVTRACPASRRRVCAAGGARVLVLPSHGGRVSLRALLDRLGDMGVLHVLCEGGGDVAASLVREKLVDEFLFVVAPRILGGAMAVPAFGGPGWRLARAPRLRFVECRAWGRDMLLRAVPRREGNGARNVHGTR